MRLLTHENQWKGGRTVVAFGMFDGVHEGHAQLMRTAIELARAQSLSSVVYTYSEHPMKAFSPERVPTQLNTRSEKIRAISNIGVDAAILRPFTREYAAMSPEAFVRSFVDTLHPAHVIIGFNFTFGCKGSGKAEDMIRFGKQFGFETHVLDEIIVRGDTVSSTRIRKAIQSGDMELAHDLLGRPYTICGVVQTGKQLGRKLGFPTANLAWPKEKAIPPNGVYAAKAYVNGKWYNAALNIGRHPTAPEGQPTLEANLTNYSGPEFYGAHIRLALFSMIRPEKKFDSLELLREEVMKNREQVDAWFESEDKRRNETPNPCE